MFVLEGVSLKRVLNIEPFGKLHNSMNMARSAEMVYSRSCFYALDAHHLTCYLVCSRSLVVKAPVCVNA